VEVQHDDKTDVPNTWSTRVNMCVDKGRTLGMRNGF